VDHVFAEFLGTSVRVVVGARPVDGRVFLDDFVLAVAGDGDRRDVREAPQAVMILSSPGELNDFESAAEIYIEALFFGFAVERRRAMYDGIARLNQRVIFVVRKAEVLGGKVAQKDSDTIRDALAEFREIHVELERLPEPLAGFLLIFRAHQKIQRVAVTAQQSGRQIAPEIPG
jgi:hypothetical protein